MVLRLSELLERIRPAGSPGSSAEGEQLREDADQERQLAEITAILSKFEVEAEQLLVAARDEAERGRRLAERRAEQIRAGLADRIAIARSAPAERVTGQGKTEGVRLEEDAANEVTRLEAQGRAQIPELIDAVMQAIWGSLPAAGSVSREHGR